MQGNLRGSREMLPVGGRVRVCRHLSEDVPVRSQKWPVCRHVAEDVLAPGQRRDPRGWRQRVGVGVGAGAVVSVGSGTTVAGGSGTRVGSVVTVGTGVPRIVTAGVDMVSGIGAPVAAAFCPSVVARIGGPAVVDGVVARVGSGLGRALTPRRYLAARSVTIWT